MADPTMPRQPRGEPACGLHARMSHASSTTSTTVRQARTMMGSTAGVLRGVTGAKLTILPARLAACWTWARGFPRLAADYTKDGEDHSPPNGEEETPPPRGAAGQPPAAKGPTPRRPPRRRRPLPDPRVSTAGAGIGNKKARLQVPEKKPGKLAYSAATSSALVAIATPSTAIGD